MNYQIFRNNILIADVEPLNSSELFQKKELEDYVRLNFVLSDYIDIQVGDYIGFDKTGLVYTLDKPPNVTESPKEYKYECVFQGSLSFLKKTKALLQTAKVGGGNYTDYKFHLEGNAQTFLDFIVSNLNRNGSGYSAGTYKATTNINVSFNNWNVFEAITELSTLLDFDWYLDGQVLHFDAKNFENGYVLQVGRKLGMTSLERTSIPSKNLQTVVYGYGSTENLPPRTAASGITYDGDTLTENRLAFDGVDGESRLEKNVDKYGRIESIQEFSTKPNRIGTVTGVDVADVNVFFDTTMDFDVEAQKIEGITPKITFLSGTLLGITCPTEYEEATNKFTLTTYTDESGSYPNALQLPQVGDTYTLIDLIMPVSYRIAAQLELQELTQTFLDDNSDDLEAFQGNVDREWVETNSIILNLGDLIRIVSTKFQIDNLYEIKELTQNINNPNEYKIKFGDVLDIGLLDNLKSINFATQQEIYNIASSTYNTNQTTNQVTNIVGSEIEWEGI